MGTIVVKVHLDEEDNCWWWFSAEFWYVETAITGGLFAEYAIKE